MTPGLLLLVNIRIHETIRMLVSLAVILVCILRILVSLVGNAIETGVTRSGWTVGILTLGGAGHPSSSVLARVL